MEKGNEVIAFITPLKTGAPQQSANKRRPKPKKLLATTQPEIQDKFIMNHLVTITQLALISALANIGYAKEPAIFAKERPVSPLLGGFADARRPISNPTLFDLALPQTQIHPLFALHHLPNSVRTTLGDLPVGGHVEAYAVQLEIALTDRLSINATKDGYLRFRPDATLSETEGWANLAAGLKYAFVLDPAKRLAVTGQLLYEIPSGDRDVLQGEGDGIFIPSVNVLKLHNRWQFANQFGFQLPIDSDANTTSFFNSSSVSYKLTERIFPMFEVNWFSVIDEGDGAQRFGKQVGGLLPAAATFEAFDLFNLGGSNADINRNLVTFAVGSRFRVCEMADLGFGWEFPVTEQKESVIEDRFYIDMVIRF